MADTLITGALLNNSALNDSVQCVWKTQFIGYCVYIDEADRHVAIIKTDDAGVTWTALPGGGSLRIHTGNPALSQVEAVDIWYDGWTGPGDNGRLYIVWLVRNLGSGIGSLHFRVWDTNSDLQADPDFTVVNITLDLDPYDDLISGAPSVTITKARGGRLYICERHSLSGFGPPGFRTYFSVAFGLPGSWFEMAGWGAVPTTGFFNRHSAFPCDAGPDDFYLLEVQDFAGTAGILLHHWDNSAFTWLQGPIVGSSEGLNPGPKMMAGTYRAGDQHVLILHHTQLLGNNTNDLVFYDAVSVPGQTVGPITIVNNDPDIWGAAIMACPISEGIYIFYIRRVSPTNYNIIRRLSTDSGLTWSGESIIDSSDNVWNGIYSSHGAPEGPSLVQPIYRHDAGGSFDELYSNPLGVTIICPGTGVGPEIQVIDGIKDIACDGTTSFGNVQQDQVVNKQLVIENQGDADLILGTITDSGHVTIDSADDPSGDTIPRGLTATITVNLDTGTVRTIIGSISIPSNDADEDPCVINFIGDVRANPVQGSVCLRYRCRTPGPGLRRDQLGFVNQP